MMPDLSYIHPQVVHFAVALLFAGVIARLVSVVPLGKLGEKLGFAGPMATTLIIVGAVASVLAVWSGSDAHGPVERVPGARDAVVEHEEWGERARNIFLVVGLIELSVILLRSRPAARWVRVSSAVLGVGGLVVLYEAAEHGGDLVYGYAGGVGIRSGDSTDLGRLLVAGLYHNAMRDRASGRGEDAARLLEEMARRVPDDPSVRLLAIESRLRDRGDAAGALAGLEAFSTGDDRQLRLRKAILTAQALDFSGLRDSARAVLEPLRADFGESRALRAALERLGADAGAEAQPPPR